MTSKTMPWAFQPLFPSDKSKCAFVILGGRHQSCCREWGCSIDASRHFLSGFGPGDLSILTPTQDTLPSVFLLPSGSVVELSTVGCPALPACAPRDCWSPSRPSGMMAPALCVSPCSQRRTLAFSASCFWRLSCFWMSLCSSFRSRSSSSMRCKSPGRAGSQQGSWALPLWMTSTDQQDFLPT